MPDHPVRRALQRDVLPYLVSARRLKHQWFYRLHVTFGYTTDVVAAMAAIGVAFPILTLLGVVSAAPSDGTTAPSLSAALGSLPASLAYPALVIVLIWVLLRVAFNREDGQKRAVLAKSCRRTLRQAEATLPGILAKPDPLPDITQLLEKQIRPTVDRGIQEDAWPWTPFASDIDSDVTSVVDALCSRYESTWEAVRDPNLREAHRRRE